MKLSNKILLSLYAFVLGTVLTVLISFRVSIGDVEAVTTELKKTEKVIPLQAFERLDFSGNLYIEVREGQTHNLRIEGYDQDSLEPTFTPTVENGILKIEIPDNEKNNSRRFKAFISTPKVTQITLNNNARIEISKFQLDTLQVNVFQDAVCNFRSVDANVLGIASYKNARVRSYSSDFNAINLLLEGNSECDLRDVVSDQVTGEVKDRSLFRFSGDISKLNVEMDTGAIVRKIN